MMRMRLSAAWAGSGALGFFVLCGGGLDDRDERHREQSADTGGVVVACWVFQALILSEIGGPLPKSTPDTSSRASVQTDKGATRPQREESNAKEYHVIE
jgi:hypothetical protein